MPSSSSSPLMRSVPRVVAPAGTPPVRQDPEQLVPGAKPGTPSALSRPSQDRELVPQQQVLEHEVVVWASPREDGREEQPEAFEHIISIADPPSREVVPPHSRPALGARPEGRRVALGDRDQD